MAANGSKGAVGGIPRPGGPSLVGVVFCWGIGKAEVACGVVLEGNGQATGLWPGRQVRPP